MLYFKIFKKFPSLIYGLSERKHGSMKFLHRGKKDQKAFKNQQNFISSFGLKNKQLVRAGLIRSNQVKIVKQKNAGKLVKNNDALITEEKNIFLSLTVADCFPVFLFDPQKQTVALIHAGWRSIIKNIIPKTIKLMKEKMGSKSADILIGIGPGIRKCHFEVQKDVANNFFKKFGPRTLSQSRGKIFIDLPLAIKIQALKSGILTRNIEDSKKCSYCLKNKYYSYRRDKNLSVKTMIAIIGLKSV